MTSLACPIPSTANDWVARLSLGFEARHGRTALVHRQRQGPLSVQRSLYPEGPVCHTYLLHPPGGIAGGDQLSVDCTLADNAHALVTTPGAGKFYRANRPSSLTQTITVNNGASLEWLPLEAIYFPGCNARQTTHISLAAGARFIGWETHCAGRPVMNEHFDYGAIDARLRLRISGQLVLSDRLSLTPQSYHFPAANHRNFPVQSTLIATPANENDLAMARQCGGDGLTIGATLIGDVLIVRALAPHTEPAMRAMTELWQALRPNILGRAPCPPRIWNT
ncbi:urease accessory protein UreD [Litorivicinus lipolyticus]|uniref:urease accessory protein UreD n=1 Tax=Litorivicinus lipolyticus TaxID=418701 RepID=UPI001B8707F0|nr:urease accessory protein UreD [Litorivicinus lipolyticus]